MTQTQKEEPRSPFLMQLSFGGNTQKSLLAIYKRIAKHTKGIATFGKGGLLCFPSFKCASYHVKASCVITRKAAPHFGEKVSYGFSIPSKQFASYHVKAL